MGCRCRRPPSRRALISQLMTPNWKRRLARRAEHLLGPIVDTKSAVLERRLREETDALRAAVGRGECQARAGAAPGDLRAAEFQVFSQWNEDGVIQHLVRNVPIADPTFIEFGVESYRESNTRFLLVNNAWRGLAIDGGDAHRRFLYSDSELGWRYPIDARTAFLTRETVNDVFRDAGFVGDVGLLSIDVDGNDYWLWDAIDVVSPRVVIVEYNSTFGAEHAVTVPYDPTFDVAEAHFSRLYFGASLPALVGLGGRKGYQFVGCESHGANAFFVRNDVAGRLPSLSAAQGYVASWFRSSRDEAGRLTFVGPHADRLALMGNEVVEHVPDGRRVRIRDLFRLD